jgi:hypothetical protein
MRLHMLSTSPFTPSLSKWLYCGRGMLGCCLYAWLSRHSSRSGSKPMTYSIGASSNRRANSMKHTTVSSKDTYVSVARIAWDGAL